MMNSIFKRDISLLAPSKDYDYQVRISGPYYSYRDPITGRREFVFDEEIQDLIDEGLTPAKAVERFLSRKYARTVNNKARYRPFRKPKQTSMSQQTTNLSPWLKASHSRRTARLSPTSQMVDNDAKSVSSVVSARPPSFYGDDYGSEDEQNDEQMPLVTMSNRRRWQLRLDDDYDPYSGTRHGAMSMLCMKDDVQRYMAACKQFEVTPSQAFIDQLGARAIRIKYHTLTPIELGPILHVLSERSTAPITSLDLSCNPLTEKAAGLLVAFLNTSAADCLSYLNVSECQLGHRGGQQIFDCVQDSFSIKELYVSANNFGDAIGLCLQNFLAVNDVLKHLDISRNGISIEAAEKLAEGLTKNTSIVSLNASWNGIRLRGAEAVCGIFALSTLVEIDLSWNGISNDGCRAISASLSERGCCLRNLGLECNRIGMLGAYALARALRHNRVLRRLDLTMNPITTEGVKAILKALINNYHTGMEQLEIRDVPIEQAFTDLIDQIRRRRTKRSGSEFTVIYGQAIHDPDFYIATTEAFGRVNDPVTILFKYIKEKGFRLHDLFAQFDKDRSSTVSLEEFRNGFIGAKIPLTEAQLDYLFGVMDVNGDGEIDYGELLMVQQQYRENMRRKKRVAKQEEMFAAEVKLPKIATARKSPHPKEDEAKKRRDKIMKARDSLIKQSHPGAASSTKDSIKLPEISTPSHRAPLRRRASFKEALDDERRKLFASVKRPSYARFSHHPPTIELEESLE